jgi:hypothetical protein
LQWVWSAAAVVLAVAAVLWARRASRRVERLTETYWELRYDYGQLRARVAQLEGPPAAEGVPRPPATASTNFVPLSSLKK